jgi:hypothetical protein
VVTIDVADMNTLQLQQEVLALRKRIARLIALLQLVMVLVKIAGFSLANARMPEQAEKHELLRAIERARSVLPLRIVLGVLRLSHARYHSWKREEENAVWRTCHPVVQPETVIRWHRQGFKLYWRWKSRRGKPGRPPIERQIRDLIVALGVFAEFVHQVLHGINASLRR